MQYTGPEHASCELCPEPAGQFVTFHDGRPDAALCFGCWHPVRSSCIVLYWINRYGRSTFAPGATTGPFRIEHP